MPKPKLIPIPKLKKKMDVLWSIAVRSRDKKCVVCGREDTLAAHHVIIRKGQNLWTRWMPENGISTCYQHHMRFIHGNQADYVWWRKFLALVLEKVGKEKIDLLIQMAERQDDPKRKDLELIYGHLQSITGQAENK